MNLLKNLVRDESGATAIEYGLIAAIIGIGGGFSGAAIGWLAAQMINARFPDRLNLYASPSLLTFSIGFSIVVGVLGGLYPAIWASRLSPMEAIRRG